MAEAVPVQCNVLSPSREAALNAARGDIELVACQRCSHVFNRRFDEKLTDYTGTYENSLHYSQTFRDYAEALAASLSDRYALPGKTVVEVGCGDTYFLGLLCRDPLTQGIGFEPRAGQDLPLSPNMRVIRDYYSERYSHIPADLVCCRQVLEHVPDPVAFVKAIGRTLSSRPHAHAFIEVPNAACILRERRIWDVIYEHFSYFTPVSLHATLTAAGFSVSGVEESFGGQYLCIHAAAGGPSNGSQPDPCQSNADAAAFAAGIRHKIEAWRSRLSDGTFIVWGAGSKGATFLNLLGAPQSVEFVVDVNPRKEGMFIAGTGHPIRPPQALAGRQDLTVLLMNPLYEREVAGMLSELGVRAGLEVV